METRAITLNGENRPLGRLASQVASMLCGKNNASMRKHIVSQQRVVVINCSKIKIQKKKLEQRLYYRTSRYPGHLRSEPLGKLFQQDPGAAFRRTVSGMLPKNKHRTVMLDHLTTKN